MQLPKKPAVGDEVMAWASSVVDYLRSTQITSFIGGKMRHTPNGTTLAVSSEAFPISTIARREELFPWKLRSINGDWQVYGTGATVENRWSGEMFEVSDLDTALTIGESYNYVYLRAIVEYGEISGGFSIAVEPSPLPRVITVDGEQTEIAVLIGTILDGVATQRLRDPLVFTLTCVAGVPAWVPILSEGVAP